MTQDMSHVLARQASAFWHFVASRRVIPMLKGTIAWILAMILIMVFKFDELSKFPDTYTSIFIIVLVCGPGKAVGACLQSTALSLIGVGVGAVGFVILAKLAHAPVAQGFIFAFIVYTIALVKARGMTWFGFSLNAILTAYYGIYSSALEGGFAPAFLEDYLIVNCWSAAIVVAVNILIFPNSSEKELRRTLIMSLDHIATFSRLLAKAYTLESTEDEAAARDHLAQSIRADFGLLTQKIEETSIEINHSRFSMNDYQDLIARTRAMQLALITVHSSLKNVHAKDLDVFKSRFLPSTIRSFTQFNRALDLTMRQVSIALGDRSLDVAPNQTGYAKSMDIEKQTSESHLGLSRETTRTANERLKSASQRLAEELDLSAKSTNRSSIPPDTRLSSFSCSVVTPGAVDSWNLSSNASTVSVDSPASLRSHFDQFSTDQHDALTQALISGTLHGEEDLLRLTEPLPSVKDLYTYRIVPLAGRKMDGDNLGRMNGTATLKSTGVAADGYFQVLREKSGHEKKSDELAMTSHHSLSRVYSYMFGTEQFVVELLQLSQKTKEISVRKARLHIHFFETLRRPHLKAVDGSDEDELELPEALALLEHKPYNKVRLNIFQHLNQLECWFRNPTSIYAAKTAGAASVFAVLLLHPVTRPWFISFALSTGTLPVVTSLTPTLGQGMFAFLFQISGYGVAFIWSFIILEIFKNVGGYHYNPYGIIAFLIPYGLAFSYMLYEVPQYFVLAVLALNSINSVLILEWINVEDLHDEHYDSPALRMGKAFSALCISLGIVATFQLFILRNPARRTLRKRLGSLLFSQLSYVTLLQAYARAAIPLDPSHRAPDAVLRRVEREMRHRELKLQAELIALRPIVGFAAAEPQFSQPFRADVINRILRTSQILQDRMRESRVAIGLKPLPTSVIQNFTKHLIPYRARNSQVIQLGFFLAASSVLSKSPLPHETPAELATAKQTANYMHDILVLSARYARTDEGKQTIRSGDFTRYVHYLVCMSSLLEHLKNVEEACREIFGELENKLA